LPDVMHSYLGLAGLSLSGQVECSALDPALNISRRALEHLHKGTMYWRNN